MVPMRPQHRGVLRGKRKSRADWKEERSGYGECTEES
jgi:hypothetical protein